MTNYVVKTQTPTEAQHKALQALGYKWDNTNGDGMTGGDHFILSTQIDEYSTDATDMCLDTCGGYVACRTIDQVIEFIE